MSIIECVPNLSEGRRPDVLDACAAAVRNAGANLLDVHTDPDHNRAVFTWVGAPSVLHAAALAFFDVAVASVDLRRHAGEHPRIGAVDVMPFVPLREAAMADCVALARDVGAEVARRHGIPVILYEEAAATPARRRLPDIRRGGLERLAARMAKPDWAPDFGPNIPHPTAGVSVIGARRPLVAYNVNLATEDLEAARRIATAVRERSGGLPGVRALAMRLAHRDLVQVSMNLTDLEATPLQRAFDAVATAAARGGVTIADSEIVGLVPEAALPPDPERTLHLRDFTPSQILDRRLAAIGPVGTGN